MNLVVSLIIIIIIIIIINIKLINHKKVCKSWNIQFHAVNMQEYDIILDYSWLNEINLNIH